MDVCKTSETLKPDKLKPPVSYDLLGYSRILGKYPTKSAAYADLGVNSRVHSPAAKVVKSRPEFSIFCCKLFGQSPPCNWSAALFPMSDGLTGLLLTNQ